MAGQSGGSDAAGPAKVGRSGLSVVVKADESGGAAQVSPTGRCGVRVAQLRS